MKAVDQVICLDAARRPQDVPALARDPRADARCMPKAFDEETFAFYGKR